MKINRQEVANFPYFFNHKSARMWLKDKYGSFFVMAANQIIKGEKVYFYHLVQDKETYLKQRQEKMEGKESTISDYEFRNTYQAIEITESGKLTVDFEEELAEMLN